MAIHTDQQCPCTTDLNGLIRGDLPASRQAELVDHVGSCSCCQSRMDSLATDGQQELSQVVRHIDRSKPPSDSAFWAALDRAEAAVTTSYISDPEIPSAEVKLDFLQPTSEPGRIGRLGQFEIIRVLGRGGMGVVLHAFDRQLQRDVAVKVLDPQWASNDTARKRFCREARAAAAVTHDNLVAVHQVNEDPRTGLPFLVMQFVNGESLDQRLRRVGRLSVGEAIRLGMQAAAGLAAAHAQGLIHRDIKPGNILIETGTEKVRLTDFGLARATEDPSLTKTGFVAGTPLYMAPEQAVGSEVDHRADLFSLGSVLYESLAGRPPFEGRTPLAVLRRVADEVHDPLSKRNPEVPSWLEEAIDRLLAKDPAERIQSAEEVAELFARQLAEQCQLSPLDVPPEACALTRSHPRVVSRNRKRVCFRLLASLLAVFVAGSVVGWVVGWEMGASKELQPGTEGRLITTVPLASFGDEGPPSRKLPAEAGAILSAALSPDGTTLATGIESGGVSVWNVARGERLFDLRPERNGQAMAHRGVVWAVEFTPDGKRLISASDDGTVKIWDLTSRRQEKELAVRISVRSATVSPDGKQVALGDRFGTVRVYNLDDPSDQPEYQYEHGSTVNGVAFHPVAKSMMLASVGTDGSVVVWDIQKKDRRFFLAGHTGPVYAVAFSPNGEQLATAGWDRSVVIWDMRTGHKTITIGGHDEGVWGVVFAPCGKVIAAVGQDGKTKVWDTQAGTLLATFARHRGTVHVARFDQKGSFLITGGRDGNVHVWDTAQCKQPE